MLCTEEKALEAAEVVSAGMITKAFSAYTLAFIEEVERMTQEVGPTLGQHQLLVLNIVKHAQAAAMLELITFCMKAIEESDLH